MSAYLFIQVFPTDHEFLNDAAYKPSLRLFMLSRSIDTF